MLKSKMKKVAFFVEGATEMIFLEKLLNEILTKNKFTVEKREMRGGGKQIVSINTIKTGEITEATECYILITDCGSDSTVKSYILEQRTSLSNSGYTVLIGLLDLYPREKKDFYKFEQGLKYQLGRNPVPVEFVISIMEIEAWFIAEKTHFQRIHNKLTASFIYRSLGLDLVTTVSEDIPNPAAALNEIYKLVGFSYGKKAKQVQRTVNKLDYADLYLTLPNSIKSLESLIDKIQLHILNQ